MSLIIIANKMSKEKEEDVEERHKHNEEDIEEFISQQLIKSVVASVFSEQAGADMGKAVEAFHKGLKDAGIPEETAVKMTEDYRSTFAGLRDVMKQALSGKCPRDERRKGSIK